jgi:acetyltransferase-like isoleucine patch superfamily enzyme
MRPPQPSAPGSNRTPDLEEGLVRFGRFLAGDTGERVFAWPTCHPSRPTGFCPCDRPWAARLGFYAKAWLLLAVLRQALNGPKIALLRRLGARVGDRVFLSTDVWIDPAFPQLLAIEDEVMVGVGVKIALHEFGRDGFRAGRVILRRGAVIGGFALLRHGIEIGEGAVVAGGAAVGRDVPAGKLAVGNPARIFPLPARSAFENDGPDRRA